jgi:hypothetical protein
VRPGSRIAALRLSGLFLRALLVAGLVAGCGGSAGTQDLSGGKKVDLGGWSLYLQCEGSGSPTVVLDAGLHDSHTGWARVETAAARKTRTCSYERAGVGQNDLRPSKPAVVPAEQVVDELHELLSEADVSPPDVLVGHSLGRLNARLFAARHARDSPGSCSSTRRAPSTSGATRASLSSTVRRSRTTRRTTPSAR